MKLENSKVCNHQICVPRSCCKLGLGDETWVDTIFNSSPQKFYISRPWCPACTLWRRFPLLMVAVWESVSPYLKKKNVTEEEKDLLCWSSIAVLRATKSSRFTCFNVSRNVRYTLLLYIRSLSCPKLTAMFFMTVRIYDWNDLSSEISYIIICDTKWKECFQKYHYQL